MTQFTLPNVVSEDMLIPFDLFPVKDVTAATEIKELRHLEASNEIINFLLRHIGWHGFKKLSVDNTIKIGYNLDVDLDSEGLTEEQAYNIWIDHFKERERAFKKIFILDSLTQSQYDGLLSLYFLTGDWTRVGTEQRQFKLVDDIKNKKWEYVATALSHSGVNRIVRQHEAKIIMLADYGVEKSRMLIKEQGLQNIIKQYPSGLLDDKARAQAEYVYYAETGRFLPQTPESRKRILAHKLR